MSGGEALGAVWWGVSVVALAVGEWDSQGRLLDGRAVVRRALCGFCLDLYKTSERS